MNIEEFRDYCIAKKGVTESFPFDKNTLVFKVMGKMFALADVETFDYINLKSDPEKAVELREKFHGIKPGYHMSKVHWNSVYVNMDVDDKLVQELIDESYQLIVASLTKKLKEELNQL
ncbi:MAG: MmcQ/YjbR family DNA-binding protein [Flavobacteriales bacterium]|nr:MmcQ/YjbR family DNA-binding protein [Flavobacteriales bacterium]MCB9174862.1 MmcQ/YjbR family DNA-binding protein [Flavobacteriales bacterium]